MYNNYWLDKNEFISAPIFKSAGPKTKMKQEVSPIKERINNGLFLKMTEKAALSGSFSTKSGITLFENLI